MVQGRLVNFRKPDQNGGAHFAGKIDIKSLMAEDTGRRQIIGAQILTVLIDEVNFLVFRGAEPAALTDMVITIQHSLANLGCQNSRQNRSGFSSGTVPLNRLRIARRPGNPQSKW
jgi:hypothetical protein